MDLNILKIKRKTLNFLIIWNDDDDNESKLANKIEIRKNKWIVQLIKDKVHSLWMTSQVSKISE